MKNLVELSGYLVSQPDFRSFQQKNKAKDTTISRVSLAYHEGPKENQRVYFFDLVGFDDLAVRLHHDFEKGNYVIVKGRITIHKIRGRKRYCIVVSEINLKQWEEQTETPLSQPLTTTDLIEKSCT